MLSPNAAPVIQGRRRKVAGSWSGESNLHVASVREGCGIFGRMIAPCPPDRDTIRSPPTPVRRLSPEATPVGILRSSRTVVAKLAMGQFTHSAAR